MPFCSQQPLEPILMEDARVSKQLNGYHKLHFEEDSQFWKLYYKLKESDEWEVVHRFQMIPRTLEDFQPTCDEYQFGRDEAAVYLYTVPCALRRVRNSE